MPDADDPLDATFIALSDSKRREMVAQLSLAPMSVKELAGPLGMRLPSAVKHLAILESSGVVQSRKTGRVRTYAIRASAFSRINMWIAEREAAMTAAFDQLEQAIARLPAEDGE